MFYCEIYNTIQYNTIPEGPGLVPEGGQRLLLLSDQLLQLLRVRVLVVVNLVGHGQQAGVLKLE